MCGRSYSCIPVWATLVNVFITSFTKKTVSGGNLHMNSICEQWFSHCILISWFNWCINTLYFSHTNTFSFYCKKWQSFFKREISPLSSDNRQVTLSIHAMWLLCKGYKQQKHKLYVLLACVCVSMLVYISVSLDLRKVDKEHWKLA